MRRWRAGWVAAFVCCGGLAAQSLNLASIKRIYVAPFAVKKGSEALRSDVISQLRKLNNVSIVSSPSNADAILDGDGEFWVKGYVSLNPRSGRLASDGRPVYSGFLSVQLKDSKGDTLWSYLITPSAASEDISKELSKRLEKYLAAALEARSPTPRP
jgi:hypothetical protein